MSSDVKDTLEQARVFEKAVKRDNDVHSMIQLARLLLYDKNFETQRARGVQMLERAIKQAQNPGAMYSLAVYLLRSDNQNDRRRAFLLLERSLKLFEHVDVLQQLGNCYMFGEGVEKDYKVAVQLLERALRLKEDPFVTADLAYGLLHASGFQAEKNRAISLYKKAIRLSSDAVLMNGLGLLYHSGTCNLRPCLKKAWKWYSRAIQTSSFPSAMYNKAVLILESDPSEDDTQQAVGLLEQALDLEKDEKTYVKLADTYLEHDIDAERAIDLYETAAIQCNSIKARSVLMRGLVDKTSKVPADHAREFDFCVRDFSKNKNSDSLKTMAEMLWTGAHQVEASRKKALELLEMYVWSRHDCISLMLRHDLGAYPGGRRRAERLMEKWNRRIDRNNIRSAESIMLSERKCASDKALALVCFREQKERRSSFYSVVWLSPHLRVGVYELPVDGRLHCVTNVMRTFTRWKNVAALNLANLLLETDGKQQEAVAVLEEVVESELRLIGMLNLSYVLMNDIQGVTKDWTRGMQLLEKAVEESNEASARAMLANALTERAGCSEEDVDRARRLWQGVKEEIDDEEELRKVGRLVSANSEEKWNVAARRHGESLEHCASEAAQGEEKCS